MSLGLSVFLIYDRRDVDIFGCRRWKLLREALDALKDWLADYDQTALVAEEGRLTHAAALREIFAGTLSRPEACALAEQGVRLVDRADGPPLRELKLP
jgi:hypothetical protein